jgi:hypothetical protein
MYLKEKGRENHGLPDLDFHKGVHYVLPVGCKITMRAPIVFTN